MKIGITSNACGGWGDNRYQKLREHEYSCIDLSMANTGATIYQCDEEEFKERLMREKKLADEAGIEIFQIHGPWRYPPRDSTEEERAERMEKMQKSIRAASLLGCKNCVIHPLMPFGIEERGTTYAQQTWDINLVFMRELLKTAKEYDVTICLENMPFRLFSMSLPEDVFSFVKIMNDGHFKICLDTGHVVVHKKGTPGDAVRQLGDEIRVLHIHDNDGRVDQHAIPYLGIIDWKDFGQALKEIGFRGAFSFETKLSKYITDTILDEIHMLHIKIAKEITGISFFE